MNSLTTAVRIPFSPFKQPKWFYLIFFIELWERFGYYGLQSILVIYLVKDMCMSESSAITLFSSFSALAYGFVAIGGWLGDKVLGTKRVIILGTVVLAFGYSIMAWLSQKIFWTYFGLAAIAAGNGLFKPNPSALLSYCYRKFDSCLECAFTMYYMAINIGSLLSTLITPWLAVHYGWNLAFSLSVIGMLITLMNFLLGQHYIRSYGSVPDFRSINIFLLLKVITGVISTIIVSTWLLFHPKIIYIGLILMILCIILVFSYQMLFVSDTNKNCTLVACIMMVEALVFFILYGQMPTSLNFFAIHNVHTSLLGIHFKPEQLQALNPFWIMIISPLLSAMYNRPQGRFPIPFKFAIGMALCSMSFIILSLSTHFSDSHGMVSVYWLILSYAIQSIGELMISGLGLAMIAQLVSQNLIGFVMGAWFTMTSLGAVIAGFIASLSAVPTKLQSPDYSLHLYSHLFMQIGIYAAIIAALMLVIAPKLSRVLK